jgi:hypothetical protein
MAQNKAFANKMVALSNIEMVADTLNHPMDFKHLIFVASLVRCLVEGFEDRLDILLSKICIQDLLAIDEPLSLQGIFEFTFLLGARGNCKFNYKSNCNQWQDHERVIF